MGMKGIYGKENSNEDERKMYREIEYRKEGLLWKEENSKIN